MSIFGSSWSNIALATLGTAAIGYGTYRWYNRSRDSVSKRVSALEETGGSFKAPVASKSWLGNNVVALTLSLPQKESVLGLAPGRHVNVTVNNDKESTRPYTPVRADGVLQDEIGQTTLVVKVYNDGKVSPQLANLKEGDEVEINGPKGRTQYDGCGKFTKRLLKSQGGGEKEITAKHIGLIAGGSGLTPMLQIARQALMDRKDNTTVTLLFANKTPGDVFLKDQLDSLAKRFPNRFKVYYTVDHADQDSGWSYETGLIDADKCRRLMPPAGDDSVVCCCGPPPMINKACKPALREVGYDDERILTW